jgi:ATP-binding cassette, subfamily F, member 3
MLTIQSLQRIGTLSGGQKSRVTFAALSLQHPHLLLLDEVCKFVYNIALETYIESVANESYGY